MGASAGCTRLVRRIFWMSSSCGLGGLHIPEFVYVVAVGETAACRAVSVVVSHPLRLGGMLRGLATGTFVKLALRAHALGMLTGGNMYSSRGGLLRRRTSSSPEGVLGGRTVRAARRTCTERTGRSGHGLRRPHGRRARSSPEGVLGCSPCAPRGGPADHQRTGRSGHGRRRPHHDSRRICSSPLVDTVIGSATILAGDSEKVRRMLIGIPGINVVRVVFNVSLFV